MKNINVKKVVAGAAALGVASMFAGAVVAANVGSGVFTPVTKSDIFNTSGVPAVNVIIGAEAKPVDVVWAGNIAGAIGHKAYTAVEGSGTATFNNVVVEVGSETSSTVLGDGKEFDTVDLGASDDYKIDSDDYSLLFDEDVSVDDDEDNVVDNEMNVKDQLTVTAMAQYNDSKDVQKLVATIDKDAIEYKITMDDGIPYGYDGSGSPKLKFHFMGKEYTVDQLNSAGNELTLTESEATVVYGIGQSFSPQEGYTIEVTEILDNGGDTNPYEASLTLKDSVGATIATDVFQAGDEDLFEDYLTASVDIDSVYSTQVKFITGSAGKIILKDGSKIEDFPATGNELWKVNFDGTGDYVQTITVTNNDSDLEYKDDTALEVGDEITLPNNFAKIQFLGLTSESTTDFKIDDGILSYSDTDDESHDLFLFNSDDGTDITEWTTDDEIDGHQIYIAIDATDGNIDANHLYSGSFTAQLDDDDGKYLQNDGTWDTTETTWYFGDSNIGVEDTYDGNSSDDVGEWFDLDIATYKNEDVLLTYGLFLTEGSDKITDIALGLKKDVSYTLSGTDVNWSVSGVAADVSSSYADDLTYVGGKTNENTIVDDDLQSVVEFSLADSVDTMKVYIDPYTGNLVDTSDTDYDAGTDMVYATIENLDTENSDDATSATTNFGTFFEIASGNSFHAVVPEDRLKVDLFLGGGAVSSDTITNGKEFTLTTEGTVMSDETTGLSAKLISKSVSDGTTGSYMTPAAWNVSNDQLVYLDSDNPSGAKIIVGGYMVNTLAQNIGLENLITTDGTWVSGKSATGDIVVAGYTATDTANAAKELIVAIENM